MKITGIKYSMLKKKQNTTLGARLMSTGLNKGYRITMSYHPVIPLSAQVKRLEGEKESSWPALEQCLQCRNRMRCLPLRKAT